MASLIPFNRSRSVFGRSLFPEFQNMIENFFNDDFFSRDFWGDTFKVDVVEKDKEYCIEADLPGVKKDEINLEVDDDGRVRISVERVENVDEEKKNYIHKERRYNAMSRTIYLADANPDDVKARLEDGVLKINIGKTDKNAGRHKIEIE